MKLRPKELGEVVGQDAAVRALQKANSHAFLFTGPSGVGKTTLARIMADRFNSEVTELDAATYSGIDVMREITMTAQYASLSGKAKAYIIDECHALSKATWQSLLKSVEEPPPHVYWFFCTTEQEKVPQTIRTRCMTLDLKPVRKDTLAEYLEAVAEQEELEVAGEIIDLVATQADGSVRQALVFLSAVNGVEDRKEALALLDTAEEKKEIIDLVRMLVAGKGLTWPGIIAMLEKVGDQNPESIRLVMVNYLASTLMRTKDEKQALRLLSLLQLFSSRPWNQSEKFAPLLLVIGEILFEE